MFRCVILCMLLLLPLACAPTTTSGPSASPTSAIDIVELLRAIPPGGTLRLGPGDYAVASGRGLLIERPIAIVGAGRDRTRILVSAGLVYIGGGDFILEDLSIAKTDRESGPVVTVLSTGNVTVRRTRFSGGVADGEEAARMGQGYGLLIMDAVRVTVADSEFSSNGSYGLGAMGSTHLTVENSRFTGNRLGGILYGGDANGFVRGNHLTQNLRGIVVRDRAAPSIHDNVITGNEWNGLLYDDTAAGELLRNTIERNFENGVFVRGEASPRIADNTISNNTLNGIVVTDRAQPTVEGNTIAGNLSHGVSFASGSGSIIRNTISSNSLTGILLSGGASPSIVDNLFRENGHVAIGYVEASAGEARGNRCEGGGGIVVLWERAQPRLEANVCELQDRRPNRP